MTTKLNDTSLLKSWVDSSPIGSTTPSTGKFTTVNTSSDATVGGNATISGVASTPNYFVGGYLQASGGSGVGNAAQGAFVHWNGPGPAGYGGTIFRNVHGAGTGGFEFYNHDGGSGTYPGTLIGYIDATGNFVAGSDLWAKSDGSGTVHAAALTGAAATANAVNSSSGVSGNQGAHDFYMGWDPVASHLLLQVDATQYGATWPISVSGSAAGQFTKGNNANGYWIKEVSTGYIRQWGRITTDINNGQLTVTWPTPFTQVASISVVAVTVGAVTFDRITYIVNGSVNVNSFQVANNGSGGFANWQADGY